MESEENLKEQKFEDLLSQIQGSRIEYVIIKFLKTDLRKSDMDPKENLSEFFKRNLIHDYSIQEKGPQNGREFPCKIINCNESFTTKSIFKKTKRGEKRFWIHGIRRFVSVESEVYAIYFDKNLSFLIWDRKTLKNKTSKEEMKLENLTPPENQPNQNHLLYIKFFRQILESNSYNLLVSKSKVKVDARMKKKVFIKEGLGSLKFTEFDQINEKISGFSEFAKIYSTDEVNALIKQTKDTFQEFKNKLNSLLIFTFLFRDKSAENDFAKYQEILIDSNKKLIYDEMFKKTFDLFPYLKEEILKNYELIFDPINDMFSPTEEMLGVNDKKTIITDSQKQDIYIKKYGAESAQYISLFSMLNDKSNLTVPSYQRAYVWNTENIDDIITDLYDLELDSNMSPLFLGTILLQEKRGGSYILDGQQRIITFSLILIWICRRLRALGLHKYSDIYAKNYLGFPNEIKNFITPRIIPDPRDQLAFSALIQTTYSNLTWKFDDWNMDTSSPSSQITEIFNYIQKQFSSRCSLTDFQHEFTNIEKLLLKLFQATYICRFILDKDDDPFDTFQRMNYRGTQLENSDLIRNVILQKAALQGVDAVNTFYNDHYYKFETKLGIKNKDSIKNNKWNKTHLDKFFTCFAKKHCHFPTKNKTVKSLTSYWESSDHIQILKNLEDFYPYFQFLTSPNQNLINSFFPKLGSRLIALSLVLAKADPPDDILPFLVGLLIEQAQNKISKKNLYECLLLITSWVVRNNFTGLPSLGGLGSAFNDTNWKSLVDSGADPKIFFNMIDKNEFRLHELTDDKFYQELVKSPKIGTRKTINSLLLHLEFNKQNNVLNSGSELESNDVRLPHLKDISVEHICPKQYKKHYPWMEESAQSHIDSLGNLLLVETPVNSKSKNEDFTTKSFKYANQSSLSMAKKLNNYLQILESDYEGKWNKEIIEKRTEELAKNLVQLFPFPFYDSKP